MHTLLSSAPPYTILWDNNYARRLRTKALVSVQDLVEKHQGGHGGPLSPIQLRLNEQALDEGGIFISLFPREENAFDSPTLIYSDTRNRWTAVSPCNCSFETAYFDLGRVWTSAKAAGIISGLAEEPSLPGSASTENIELLLLLLRHAFGDNADLPPKEKKGRPGSIIGAASVHTRFLTGDDELITLDTDPREGDTFVRCSAESTSDLQRSGFVTGFGKEPWQGIHNLGQW